MDLVILAAGMGSRFGGLKQMTPMDSDGNFIIDYSIYDAIKVAGFDRVVFVIKKAIKDDFLATIGKRMEEQGISVAYAYQELEKLPQGYSVPQDRVKPFGTAHALLCCKNIVKDNFAIINADDFYGRDAFITASNFLKKIDKNSCEFGLVSYKCANTLSENGATKRAVCKTDNNGYLTSLIESSIARQSDGTIVAEPLDDSASMMLKDDTKVSMNMLCFTPQLFDYLEANFPHFLDKNLQDNPLKCEYLIPDVLDEMRRKGIATVKVETTNSKWFGVTYKEDKPMVVEALKALRENGTYPQSLWDKEKNIYC